MMKRLYNFRKICRKMWKYICQLEPNSTHDYTEFPQIRFKHGFCSLSSKILAETLIHQHKIYIYLRLSRKFRLKTLVHELLHARGFYHDPRIGYNTSAEEDKFSEKVMRKMGLYEDLDLYVL